MWGALFPGQGSQHVGMGKFLYDNFRETQLLFEEASDTLGIDLKKLCFEGPENELNLTSNTQPSLLLVSVATSQVLELVAKKNWLASAGHSVGEYAALVTAGVLNFSDAIRAVRNRGEAMQSAVPVGLGGMSAVIGLDEAQVRQLCEWAVEKFGSGPLEPANFNSPDQIVISGAKEVLEWLNTNLKADIFDAPPKRIRLIPLKVSAPFHCTMMAPAEEKMKHVLQAIPFKPARYPIVQNVNALPEVDPEKLRLNLIRQISSSVRWVDSIKKLSELGVKRCVELGPGKVLAGLVKKIDSERLETLNITSIDELKLLERL